MSNLRTFKEFFEMHDHMEIDHYTLNEVKQEAIKWIKENKKHITTTLEHSDIVYNVLNDWIKHFFNIAEGDLK